MKKKIEPRTVNILDVYTTFDKLEGNLGDKLFKINENSIEMNNEIVVDHIKPIKKEPFKIVLLYWLYIFFGLPFTLLSQKKTFSFLQKNTHNTIFDLNIYNLKIETKILTNFILYFISVYFLMKKHKVYMFPHLDYNWDSLYKSIRKNGFIPYRYKEEDNLYGKELIKINACIIHKNNIDTKHQYKSLNGNHRIYLLKQMYPKGKEIEVLFEN